MIHTYKLIPLALLTLSCLSNAASTQEQITDKKAQIATLQADLQKLEAVEASLPKNIEQKEAEALAAQIEKNKLQTHAEFGFMSTSGNTDTTAYSLDLKMKKAWDEHIFAYSLDAQYADDKGVETTNKFLTELTYDYQFTDRFAFSYLAGYKDDKFSGYNYQAYTGPGAKYKIIQEKEHNLNIEANILYSQDELDDSTTEDYTAGRAKAAYEWQVLEDLLFTQELSYRSQLEDSENYFVYSKTALISKISDVFSLGVNYKVDYVNMPPLGIKHSDKTFSASLIIDY